MTLNMTLQCIENCHCFLLQCSVCSLYRKKLMMKKKGKKKILPTYPNFFEHVTPNTYNFFLAKSVSYGG